jgi:hypothetical protein
MPSLTATITAVLLAMVRPSVSWAPVPNDRIEIIADDIALAAQLHDGAPFTGPDRVLKLALAGSVIALHESNLAEKVVSCRYDGDPLRGWEPGRGRSITHFQLHKGAAWFGHTKAEICRSGPLSAYLALGILGRHTGVSSPRAAFNAYASGSAARYSKAAGRQCAMWERAGKFVGISTACWSRL